MRPHTQALGDTRSTATTVLTGVLRRYRNHFTTGPCSLVVKDGEKLPPARIADALAEMPIPHHVADLKILMVDDIVGGNEFVGFLVLIVQALACHRLMHFRQVLDRLLAPLTSWLAATHLFAVPAQLLFRFAIPARILDMLPLAGGQERLQPHVDAHFVTRLFQ